MYDTETAESHRKHERSVHAWMRAAAYAAGTEVEGEFVAALEPVQDDLRLSEAVERKKRDNLALERP